MRKLRNSQAPDGVILEVDPGQAWDYEEWHQPLYGTLGRGTNFILVGPSTQGMVLPFAGMGADEEGAGTMYEEKHLKRVHLSRLSPVMWGWKTGYPRKELGVPIKPAFNGMGAYESATPINPKGSPIWSETWQQRAAGALQRVSPQAMDGCSCNCGMGTEGDGPSFFDRAWIWVGLVLLFGSAYLSDRYTKGP